MTSHVSSHSGVTFIATDSSWTKWSLDLLLLLLPNLPREERMEDAMLDAKDPRLPRLIRDPARSTFCVYVRTTMCGRPSLPVLYSCEAPLRQQQQYTQQQRRRRRATRAAPPAPAAIPIMAPCERPPEASVFWGGERGRM